MSVLALSPQPQVRTSRSVVIGLGELGLQAICLLLPRLEVYYQFVADQPAPPALARLGLVSRQSGVAEYHSIDRAAAAFANTLEIQQLVLRPPAPAAGPLRPRLLELIEAPLPDQAASLRIWLDELIQPAITDVLDHTSSIIHLNLYLIASAGEAIFEDLEALVRELADRRRPPVTVNLISHLGVPLAASDPAGAQSASFVGQLPALAAGGMRIQRIYMLDRSKQNLAMIESLGEAATAICNFLEQLILGGLGDSLAEMGLPDAAALAVATPYSTFGAAKLYVPIAEISSEVLAKFVAELLQRELQAKPQGDVAELTASLERALELGNLCRTVLSGLPVEAVERSSWLRVRLQELAWRLRGEASGPAAARERLLRALPRLRVSRRYWRTRLRAYGRQPSADRWWRALSEFEAELLDHALRTTTSQAAQQLGVEIEDERLVSALISAPTRRDSIEGELDQGTVPQRAARLSGWVRSRRPDLQPAAVAAMRTEAQDRIFGSRVIEQRQLLATLGAWLGHRLWASKPGRGRLGELVSSLRHIAARALAGSVAWAGPLAQALLAARPRVAAIREQLRAWADADNARVAAGATHGSRLRLADEQAHLVAALRARPYPAALMARLAIIWLLPVFLTVSAVRAGLVLPPPWDAQLSTLIVGYTALIIVFYLFTLGLAALRRARAQARIEALVFAHVARVFERRMYAAADAPAPAPLTAVLSPTAPAMLPGAPATPGAPAAKEEPVPGLIPAYLQAFDRQLLDPPLADPRLPSSLFATLDGARALLAAGHSNIDAQSRAESVLCRSIGDRLTRELLEAILREQLANSQITLQVDADKLADRLESPAMVNGYLRQVLKTQLGREYVTTVRTAEVLRLRNLLLLPEHRRVSLVQLIDDLRLRARPMVSTAQGAAQQTLSRETLHYLAAIPEVADELLRPQLGREQGLYANAVRDPYGIGFTTIIHGLSAEALPVLPAARRRP